jgi:hypothetical protein
MPKQIKADLDQVVEVMMRVIVNGESGYINNLVGQYEEDFLQSIRTALDQFVAVEEDTASLRTELERVKKYARHDDECLSNIPDMNLAQKYDIVCTCGLEGGGDDTLPHPPHPPDTNRTICSYSTEDNRT